MYVKVAKKNETTTKGATLATLALGLALAISVPPATAMAQPLSDRLPATQSVAQMATSSTATAQAEDASAASTRPTAASAAGNAAVQAKDDAVDYVIPYDRAVIDAIGSQEQTGHSICCPSFSCAYADAVLDGTVHDHSYYNCSCCMWPDWGGGESAFRCVGSDEQLLREAYDQIAAGRPTVIHVAGVSGEHWIALIGYCNAADPDHLSLDNFIALDPWDAAQIVASERYSLYGDGCEHISTR